MSTVGSLRNVIAISFIDSTVLLPLLYKASKELKPSSKVLFTSLTVEHLLAFPANDFPTCNAHLLL